MFPRCGPVLFYPVRSCPLMSCPVQSCPMPLSPCMSCHVFPRTSFSYSFSFCFCCFPLSVLSLCLSVCLVFFLSVFVFCPPPCFEHLSTVQACTRTQMTALCVQSVYHSRAHFTLLSTVCVSSSRDWVVSRSSHKQQNIDMANCRVASCTQEPLRRSWETAGHSAPASLPLHLRNALVLLHPFLCGVHTVSQLFPGCAAALHVDGSSHFSNDHRQTRSLPARTPKCLAFQRPRCMSCGRRQLAPQCFVPTVKRRNDRTPKQSVSLLVVASVRCVVVIGCAVYWVLCGAGVNS